MHCQEQNVVQNTIWFSWVNKQKITDNIGLHLDVQIRSADDIAYVRNVVLRPGITYFFNAEKNATIGYAYNLTHLEVDEMSKISLNEHRIWEQFNMTMKVGKLPLTHRIRSEQRFIEQRSRRIFSQRLRYLLRSHIPLQIQSGEFKKGPFLLIQDEVFFNIINKNKLNTHFFDLNRFYLAFGYRLNATVDLEMGYLNQSAKGLNNYTINNIVQVAINTRFQ